MCRPADGFSLAPLVLVCSWGSLQVASGVTNLSVWAIPGASGRMLRQPDALGNRVLDYSGVGYKGGTVPIPDVPVKVDRLTGGRR